MKLVVTEFLSLDGVMENPGWTFPYWNDDIAAFKGEETEQSAALLLGRKTYDGFAQAWPGRDDPGADFFNGVRKYVVSNTLTNPAWNNSQVISGDVAARIRELKDQPGKDLYVHGSGLLTRFLLEQGLVDEVRLLIYPVVLGTGQRLFPEGISATFTLKEARPMPGGPIGLIYAVAADPPPANGR